MQVTRREFVELSVVAAATLLAGCANQAEAPLPEETAAENGDASAAQVLGPLALNSAAWRFDAENDVYWQIGLPYCSTPEAKDLEQLAIFVPGPYFNAEHNGDDTFTCSIGDGSIGGFSARNAPICLPIDTPGYSAQGPLSQYNYLSASEFLEAGFVYVHVGCRGRNSSVDDESKTLNGGAPWGVTDLKAAVRYLRYNSPLVPGSTDAIFAFGGGSGGAQAAVLGTSGNDARYLPYLRIIGAALDDSDGNDIRDDICGVACWCPNTSLGQADAAYEWMMGQYVDDGTRADGLWTRALSQELAQRFAQYIQEAGFVDSEGKSLVLEESDESMFTKGSYYDYLLSVIENSLGDFLSDTSFPYEFGPRQESENALEGGILDNLGNQTQSDKNAAHPTSAYGNDGKTSATIETPQDYIDWLNEDETWVTYDQKTKKVTISSIGAFVRHCKQPAKDVPAFDTLDRSSAENALFCTEEHEALHFSEWTSSILQERADDFAQLEGWDDAYPNAYASDLEAEDAMELPPGQRLNMLDPLFFLKHVKSGLAQAATHWRIHSGIEQSETALTTEVNMALALDACEQVEDVEFRTIWGQGYTTAERDGNATDNAIAWVKNIFLG